MSYSLGDDNMLVGEVLLMEVSSKLLVMCYRPSVRLIFAPTRRGGVSSCTQLASVSKMEVEEKVSATPC